MPDSIVYCDRCGHIILPSALADGKAVRVPSGFVCTDCAKEEGIVRPHPERAAPRAVSGRTAGAVESLRPPSRRRALFLAGVSFAAATLGGVAIVLVVTHNQSATDQGPWHLPQAPVPALVPSPPQVATAAREPVVHPAPSGDSADETPADAIPAPDTLEDSTRRAQAEEALAVAQRARVESATEGVVVRDTLDAPGAATSIATNPPSAPTTGAPQTPPKIDEAGLEAESTPEVILPPSESAPAEGILKMAVGELQGPVSIRTAPNGDLVVLDRRQGMRLAILRYSPAGRKLNELSVPEGIAGTLALSDSSGRYLLIAAHPQWTAWLLSGSADERPPRAIPAVDVQSADVLRLDGIDILFVLTTKQTVMTIPLRGGTRGEIRLSDWPAASELSSLHVRDNGDLYAYSHHEHLLWHFTPDGRLAGKYGGGSLPPPQKGLPAGFIDRTYDVRSNGDIYWTLGDYGALLFYSADGGRCAHFHGREAGQDWIGPIHTLLDFTLSGPRGYALSGQYNRIVSFPISVCDAIGPDNRQLELSAFGLSYLLKPEGNAAAAFQSRMELLSASTGSPANEGYLLSMETLVGVAAKFDSTKTLPKKLGTIGGPLAASKFFDASTRAALDAEAGYSFSKALGLAGPGVDSNAAFRAFSKYLKKERPEVVRICFDESNLAKSGKPEILQGALRKYVELTQACGAVPILYTIPAWPLGKPDKVSLVETHNEMILKLAATLNVPCIGAYEILSVGGPTANNYFDPLGRLKPAGLDAIGARFIKLYAVLERWIPGREGAVSAAFASRRPAGQESDKEAGENSDEEPDKAADQAPVQIPSETRGATRTVALRNSGFETQDPDERFPQGWRAHNWGAAAARFSVRADRSASHQGDYSLAVRAIDPAARPGAFTTVALAPGTYEVAFWASADVGSAARVRARLGNHDLATVEVGEEWELVRATVQIKDRVPNATLAVIVESSRVRVWFDDVSLTYSP